ncbi:MAG: NUDIX domain-containing protein [Spirochaetota bacterium]
MVLSAGVVVVRKENGEWRYLFLRVYKNWDFPKGEVAFGEDPLEAAVREVSEETGIKDLRFTWGYIYKETPPYSGGRKVARYYIAETSSRDVVLPVSPELGRPEHHGYRWATFEELKKLAPERLAGVVEWAQRVVGM